jgi:PIN domain nuclease of toxin-antitoxin system
MRLLLDTDLLIPIIERRTEHLPATMREAVLADGAVVHVSVVSLWEIAIKKAGQACPWRSSTPAARYDSGRWLRNNIDRASPCACRD